MSKFRSRKWMLTVGVQVVATLALFFGYLDGADWTKVSMTNVAAYSLANAAEFFKANV